MRDIRREFESRTNILQGTNHQELRHRLAGLVVWMENEPEIKAALEELKGLVNLDLLLNKNNGPNRVPPPASSLEEIALIGWMVMDSCRKGQSIHTVSHAHTLGGNGNQDEIAYNILSNYVHPLLSYIRDSLPEVYVSLDDTNTVVDPPIIKESLEKFRSDHPDSKKTGFLMVKFGQTLAHATITEAVRTTLTKYGLEALRADGQEYHEDLFPNVQTYMHGCGFGIAVMERIEAEDFNPNVSLEIGYMLAHRKPVLLLKDSTLKQLHADLVGKLYRPFDFQRPHETIPVQLKSCLEDKGLI